MDIGNVIRTYRKKLRLTQAEMAERLGVTTPAVNKWENNNTQPDIGLLSASQRTLSCPFARASPRRTYPSL